jgi:hypothetical protein
MRWLDSAPVNRLIFVVVAGVVLCAAGLIFARVADQPPDPDCEHVDRALRLWATAVPGIYQNVPTDSPTAPGPTATAKAEARTADDIRGHAELIERQTLRSDVVRLADAVDMVSTSRRAATDPMSPPSKDYIGGINAMNSTVHDLKQACPEAGD